MFFHYAERAQMLISSALLIAAAVHLPGQADAMFIQDDVFHISGTFCIADDCNTLSRSIQSDLQFMDTPKTAHFDRAVKLDRSWHIRLECIVKRDRLKNCRNMSDTTASSAPARIGLKLVNGLRLVNKEIRERHAIIWVNYDISECPFWRCTPILAPSPSPLGN